MRDGEPVMLDAKAHGLGHLLPPEKPAEIAPDGVDEEAGGSKLRPWMRDAWENIVRGEHGLPKMPLAWLDFVAAGRITVSKPLVARSFAATNAGKPYWDRIKPFNFIITAQIDAPGPQFGRRAERVRLIAPFARDAAKWGRLTWRNLYDTHETFRVTSDWERAGPGVVKVATYRDVLAAFRFHPGAKSAGADGQPCLRQTVGLLARRQLVAVGQRFIGKETNQLEAVQAGLLGDPADVYTEYEDARRDRWRTDVLPVLRAMRRADLALAAGLHPRRVTAIRNGHAEPRPGHRAKLIQAAGRHARQELGVMGIVAPKTTSTHARRGSVRGQRAGETACRLHRTRWESGKHDDSSEPSDGAV